MAPKFTRRHDAAVEVLNDVLLPAMKEVGDKFGAGELILPYVLQSAEVMKKTVAYLEQFLEKLEGVSKGKVVLATVYGDVHDIGKSLVNTILSNNGYTVYDIGKQVPVNDIVAKAIEVKADAIGLSALLVNTSRQMPLCAMELHRRGLDIPIIVGGAAINRRFGRRINFVDESQQSLYAPGVFYCKDAFEGLNTVDQLVDPTRRASLIEAHQADILSHRDEERAKAAAPAAPKTTVPAVRRSPAVKDMPVATPPFWGYRTLEIDWKALDQLLPYVDRNTLFRGQWRYTIHDKAEWQRIVDTELEPRLRALWQDAKQKRWLQPRAIYGYFPVQADGNDLIVYDPDDYRKIQDAARSMGAAVPGAESSTEDPADSVLTPSSRPREVLRFAFPRQPNDGTKRNEDQLCLSDYFRPVKSGDYDVLPLQVVTAGQAASEYTETLRVAGEYNTHLQVHGVSVQAAEAMAEYVHRLVRRDLGLAEGQGNRYSWGYPACPELDEQQKLFQLMPVTDSIGVRLTEGFQLDPEQSTAALVVLHPQAKYFSVLTADSPAAEAVAAG